eukprot:1188592-Prorocentrum_minimum.AAC.2
MRHNDDLLKLRLRSFSPSGVGPSRRPMSPIRRLSRGNRASNQHLLQRSEASVASRQYPPSEVCSGGGTGPIWNGGRMAHIHAHRRRSRFDHVNYFMLTHWFKGSDRKVISLGFKPKPKPSSENPRLRLTRSGMHKSDPPPYAQQRTSLPDITPRAPPAESKPPSGAPVITKRCKRHRSKVAVT